VPRYPGATWKPLPQNARQPHIVPTTIVLHSTAGGTLASNWALFDSTAAHGDESHFVVGYDGTVWQVMDTAVRADAQWDANNFAVSIETLSNPKASDAWSPLQMTALTALVRWLLGTHSSIPHHACTSWNGGGIGYHRQFVQWNHNGHTCPGDARVRQFPTLVAAAVAAPKPPPVPAPVGRSTMPPFMYLATAASGPAAAGHLVAVGLSPTPRIVPPHLANRFSLTPGRIYYTGTTGPTRALTAQEEAEVVTAFGIPTTTP
jgi:hypothetical protein